MAPLLFHEKGPLSNALDAQRAHVRRQIQELSPSQLAAEGLTERLYEELKVTPIELDIDGIFVESEEGDIDLRRTNQSFFLDEDDVKVVKGTYAVMNIPYTGEQVLLDFRPSQFNFNPPRADVTSKHILIRVPLVGGQEAAKQHLESVRGSLQTYVDRQRGDIDVFNTELPKLIEEALAARRKQLDRAAQTIQGLGYPTKPPDR